MVVPAVLFAAVNMGGPGLRGWGIPMATDIAFALGVLAAVIRARSSGKGTWLEVAQTDAAAAVNAALRRIRPDVLICMETELWPNLFNGCRKRGIPLVLANARLSARSTAGYRRVPRLMAKTLRGSKPICGRSMRSWPD